MWETEPDRRPADLQDKLENLGLAWIGEIEIMLAQIKAAGLRGAFASGSQLSVRPGIQQKQEILAFRLT